MKATAEMDGGGPLYFARKENAPRASALGKDASRQMVRLEGEPAHEDEGNLIIRKRTRQVLEAQKLSQQLDKIQGSTAQQLERNAQLRLQDQQHQMLGPSSWNHHFQEQDYLESAGLQDSGTSTTARSLVHKRKFLNGQTTQAELIFHPGQQQALVKRCQGDTSLISDLDSGPEGRLRASQVLHEIERYFRPSNKDLLPRKRGPHEASSSAKPERPYRHVELASASSRRESDIQELFGTNLQESSMEQGSFGLRRGGETEASGLASTRRSQQRMLDSSSPDVLIPRRRRRQNSTMSSQALEPSSSHREHQLACARSAISQLQTKISATPLYQRKLEGKMGYTKSKLLRISERSPRRKVENSSSRKAEDDQKESQATNVRLPVISNSEVRAKQSEVSGTETSGSVDDQVPPDDDQDAEGEPKISRFMSQREKDLLWVAKERKRMLRESKKLEANCQRVLQETKIKEQDKHVKGVRAQNSGVLPSLDELDSRGTTLSSRIKNYKTNLTALEGPVLDQIEGVLQKIRIDNDHWQRTERKARLQLLHRYGTRRTRSYLGPGARGTAGALSSSPLSGASSSHPDYSSAAPSKHGPAAESKLRLQWPPVGRLGRMGSVLLDSVKNNPGRGLQGPAPTAEQKGAEIVRVKSKAEIREDIDRNRQLRRHREEKKGLKMQGSSGSLNLTEVDRMQATERERYIKIDMPKQVDHLVYKSHEADSEQERRNADGDRSDSSYESDQTDKDADAARRRRSMSQSALQARLFPSKIDQQRNRRFLEALQSHASSEQLNLGVNEDIAGSIVHQANFLPAGPLLSKSDRRRIQNLSMLQDHRPSSKERDLRHKMEHRRLLTYLEQLQQNIARPKLQELRRLHCLDQRRYEYLDLLNKSKDPGGLHLRDQLAGLLQESPSFDGTPSEASPKARRGSEDRRAAGRATRATFDSGAALRAGKRSILPNLVRSSAAGEERFLRGTPADSQNKSSGLGSDDSLINESHQEKDSWYFKAFHEYGQDQANRRDDHEGADILVAASKSFGRGWRRALNPDQRRADAGQLDEVQVHRYGDRRTSSRHLASDYASELDLESIQYGNESQLGHQKDSNDEQAFRKNKSNQESQQELVEEISSSLIQKLKDISSKRQYVTRTASVEHMKHNQPAFAFFAECMQQQELDVPVFQGLTDHALFIQSQHLGAGQCAALHNGFRVIRARHLPLQEVILHNNNLTDANQAVIIEGTGQLVRLKRFESVGNDFKDKSIEQIGQLILRPAPTQLKELKLSDCKLSTICTEKLLKILSKKCSLELLCLQKAHYNKQAIAYLCEIIDHAKFLSSLDISWCYIPKQQSTGYYIKILSALGQNRKLSYINVSWNNFCGYLPGAHSSEEDLKNKQEEIADLITRILKYNKKIVHLNLENTGLTRPMVEIIYPALRKAMSLQSLHLSNNPWLLKLLKEDPSFVARIHKKIRAKINKRPYVTAANRPDRKLKLPASNYEMIRLGRLQQKYAYLKSQTQLDLDVHAFWKNKFIIQRRLGHKLDLPGSGQWQIVSDIVKHQDTTEDASEETKPEETTPPDEAGENKSKAIAVEAKARDERGQDQEKDGEEQEEEEPYEQDLWKLTLPQPQECCWVCSHQRYVLLFWSHKIAQQVQLETKRLQKMELASFVHKLLQNVNKMPDEEEKEQISQHLRRNPTKYTADEVLRDDLIRDPELREQFARALQFQRKKEFGPIVNASLNQDAVILKLLERKYEKYTHIFYDEKYDLAPEQTPHVLGGAVGDFHPQEMIELTEYCQRLDVDPVTALPTRPPKTDILKQMRDQYTIGEEVTRYEELTRKQKLQYKLIANREERVTRKDCLALLVDSLRYRQPLLVNSEAAFAQLESDSSGKVYVLPMFLPPGKHTLLLSQKDRFHPTESCNLVLQTLLVEPREEPIEVFCKKAKSKRQDARAFAKEKSVFKDWQEDNKKILDKCLNDHDFQFWKVGRFIKDKIELDEVKQLLTEHMPQIKELYAFIQAESMIYPGINQTTLSDLCKILQVLDKNFQSKDSDRHFVACTSVRNKEQVELIEAAQAASKTRVEPNTSLFSWQGMKRFEFLEFLLRLIRNKYIEHMGYTQVPPALRHFFKHYLPHFFNSPHVKLWQPFREKELWTLEVNDCLHANLENLRKVYTSFCGKPRTFMNRAEAIRFMQWGAEAGAKPEAKKKATTQHVQEPELSKSPRGAVEGADLLRLSSALPADGMSQGLRSPRQLDDKKGRAASQAKLPASPPRATQSARSSRSRGQPSRLESQKGSQGLAQGPTAPTASYLTLSEKQASFCYSMCKMTVIHEEIDGLRHYDKLQFVEFLELLGRIASVRFEGTDLHSQPLVIRLEYVVESALAILGFERIEVAARQQDWSESDPDY